jgi:hypothetical protein
MDLVSKAVSPTGDFQFAVHGRTSPFALNGRGGHFLFADMKEAAIWKGGRRLIESRLWASRPSQFRWLHSREGA